LTIDLEREEDGRWIAEALELPGVMCYGQTRARQSAIQSAWQFQMSSWASQ
jgi:predicted RNase H-like HicB family nuclease